MTQTRMAQREVTQRGELSPAAKADIQGFVTSGFGHLPFAAYLMLELHERTQAQVWLEQLRAQVTTAVSWRQQAGVAKSRPARTLNIAFTYAGLQALGLAPAALRTFPEEFRLGMADATRSRILGDTGESAPAQWELGASHNEAIHAMLILHAQSEVDLGAWCEEQRQALQATLGAVVEHARSSQLGHRPPSGTEHFGFFDGVAQPQIAGIKGTGVNTGEFIFGYQNEYGFYPLSPVVPPAADPHRILPASANPFHQAAGYRDFGMNGSFVVYRKLAQDVAAFWRFLQNESALLKGAVDPRFMVWLAAKMVGRWPSGAPLILAPEEDRPELRSDEFLYAQRDPNALLCPFGSHVRRTNPRDQIGRTGPTESLHMTLRHRILRRGKLYGPDLFDTGLLRKLDEPGALQAIVDLQDDGQARGVHFLCINASIKSQFEFIQQVWVNNPTFGGLLDNRDPLTGDNDPAAPSIMVVPGAQGILRTSPLPRFVHVRGGAYFFMPSLAALRYLAQLG